MKKNLLLIMLLIGVSPFFRVEAQWCIPLTAIPYSPDMPGITHFVVNTIDRVSTDLEDMNNSYVNTGLSTELLIGQAYPVTISYTIDPTICPDMNLRVWIDYNHDGQLDDVGETVINANNQLPTTYTGSFTVPASAQLGITRMRVTAKMTSLGGHSLPTPCDDPPDLLGYHGEFEDYNVNILNPTGVNSTPGEKNDFRVHNISGRINFSYSLKSNAVTGIELLDLQGRMIKNVLPKESKTAGEYSCELNSDELSAGIYLAVLTCNNIQIVKRIIVE